MNNQQQHNQFLQQEESINWRKYIYLFLSNWIWFAMAVFVALAVAYLINRYSETSYEASASFIFEDENNQQDMLTQIRAFRFIRNRQELQNERAKLKSFTIAHRTVDKLDGFDIFFTGHGRIREKPLFKGQADFVVDYDTSFEQAKNIPIEVTMLEGGKYRLQIGEHVDQVMSFGEAFENESFKFKLHENNGVGYYKYSFYFTDPNQLANTYRNKLQVIVDEKENGTVIGLKIKDVVPERAVLYINTLCEEYINFGLERKNETTENMLHFIDEQIGIITDSLVGTEKQMVSFRLTSQIYDLGRQGEMAFDQLQRFNEKKMQLLFQQKYYRYMLEALEKNEDIQKIIVPSVVNVEDPLLNKLVTGLIELYSQKEELEFSTTLSNPGIEMVNKKIANQKRFIIESIQSNLSKNQNEINKVEDELGKVNKTVKMLPVSERELFKIQQQYDIYNKFYTFLLERRAEAGIQKASNVSEAQILDESRHDQVAELGVNKKMNFIIALFAGLMIPGAIIFLLDFLNDKIRTKEDIEDKTHIPILGTIGHSAQHSEIPVHEDPKSLFAEAFRRIRTNLQYYLREKDEKVIMVTSTISGEGKTFIAINVAAILAMAGKKVLLVGLDLRRPKIHKIFGLDNSAGISTFLIGKNKMEDIVHDVNINNMQVAVSGPVPPNPAELLETEKMDEFINNAKTRYDYVVIDTPPVALVTDTLLISKKCDLTVYIVRQDYSQKNMLEMINYLDKEKKFNHLNLLVNDIRFSRPLGYKYYYGYGYGYGYEYNYGYGYGKNQYYSNENATERKFLKGRFRKGKK